MAEILRGDPILGRLSGVQLSALMPHISRREIAAGASLFARGEAATTLYVILRGAVRLEDRAGRGALKDRGFAGEEALLGLATHADSAVATEPTEVLAIPARPMAEIAHASQELREGFFRSYVDRHDAPDTTPVVIAATAPPMRAEGLGGVLGWILTIVLPFAILQGGAALGLGEGATDFLAIIAATVCMWLFGLMPEYVPPLFAALAVILLDVAPPAVALSGFHSESFFMCLSVFGLGALMVTSGLTYRFSLWVLAHLPASSLGYNLSLFGTGALLSPVIPSVLGRVVIVSPLLIDLIKVSSAGAHDRFANRLIYSLLCGASLLVPLFLTASVPNLVIYGLFDAQTQFAFDWVSWLLAASFFGLLVVLGFVAVSAIFFGRARRFAIPADTIAAQRSVLGPMSVPEWAALLGVLSMMAGILTEDLHQVPVPWIALSILVALLLFGTLQRDILRANVDWTILIYIGTIVSWVPVAALTGLDAAIVRHLGWLGASMDADFPLFVAMVAGLILLIRLALPTGVTVVLFATALFPLADAAGVSLWVVGFIIVAVADTFVFPYQSSYFLKLRSDLTAEGLAHVLDDRRIVAANIALIAIRVAALYGCLLFWTSLDLI